MSCTRHTRVMGPAAVSEGINSCSPTKRNININIKTTITLHICKNKPREKKLSKDCSPVTAHKTALPGEYTRDQYGGEKHKTVKSTPNFKIYRQEQITMNETMLWNNKQGAISDSRSRQGQIRVWGVWGLGLGFLKVENQNTCTIKNNYAEKNVKNVKREVRHT